jgi:hypothetical protein
MVCILSYGGVLTAAFPRTRTYLWFLIAVAGFCIRTDLLNISSFVRVLRLQEKCCERLLDMFHCSGLEYKSPRNYGCKPC